MQLILASGSPRRRELLAQIRKDFTVEPSLFGEGERGLSARDTVSLFAREKAKEVHARFPAAAVLGADTVVSLDGVILGKPADKADAARMLRLLSGRTHSVLTGVCLIAGGKIYETVCETEVTFFPLGEALIERYVQSGLPLDKAGAYGIQDGYPLAERIAGSYTNVVGLPVEETRELLSRAEGALC